MASRRIGLFGGSFNPVHLGHLLIAQAAREEVPLDRVVFIPAAESPFKPGQPLLPGTHRLRLLRLALAGQTACEVDPIELDRGGISYTVDTVREFVRRHPDAEFFYLLGADHLDRLHEWRDSPQLARLIQLVVFRRPGIGAPSIPAPFRGALLEGFPLGVSSSQVRERIRHGLPIDLLTGWAVAEDIGKNRLYL